MARYGDNEGRCDDVFQGQVGIGSDQAEQVIAGMYASVGRQRQ
ncbi:Uncharacterised protein [Mycobacteroides abscessus]|nr:Uncharacterised protein [Mycobacteroides abscessus]